MDSKLAEWTAVVKVQYYGTEEFDEIRPDGVRIHGTRQVKDGEPKLETVKLTVDFEAIVRLLGPRACRSKGGRAQDLQGLVVVRKVD